MKEYGSEFSYMNNSEDKNVLVNSEFDYKIMRCGRDALSLVANEIKISAGLKEYSVLVPSLSCESMIKPFTENGFKGIYYKINKDITIFQEDILEKIEIFHPQAILIMHYFRWTDYSTFYSVLKEKSPKLIIIEDITQIALFVSDEKNYKINNRVDFQVASVRKWFGIPNGAIARNCKNNFLTECVYKQNVFTENRIDALRIKKEYEQNKIASLKENFRELFAKAEKNLNYNEFLLADNVSKRMIENLNVSDINNSRELNCRHLRDIFKRTSGIRLFPFSSVFSLPIIVENNKRDVLQQKLAEKGLYTQVLWPLLDEAKESDNIAAHFSENMLSIPIDQRYDYQDIEKIGSIIKTTLELLAEKKILIIGASILQLPAIKTAKEMGFFVGVIDYDEKAIGIDFADKYFCCSTIDTDGICQIAKEFVPNGIMTMATDAPMRAIASVCAGLGLNAITIECSEVCTNKLKMIERFKKCNIESPWYKSAKSIDELKNVLAKISFPCIMKPVDSSGSRGVVLCNNQAELISEYSYSVNKSKEKTVIIEEYMKGDEVSVEVFVENGIANVLQITDKITTGAPHFVETGHTQPSRLKTTAAIEDLAKRAVIALGILDGPAHVEIMSTANGVKIIEIGARMGGDCITSHLVPLSTGINMTKNTICYATRQPLDLGRKYNKSSAIRYIFSSDNGIIDNILGKDEAIKVKNIVEVAFTKHVGDEVRGIFSSSDRIGYVIASADTIEECEEACKIALSKLNISFTKGRENR